MKPTLLENEARIAKNVKYEYNVTFNIFKKGTSVGELYTKSDTKLEHNSC